MVPVTWVVGSGGLLGRSVMVRAREAGRVVTPSRPVVWAQPETNEQLALAVDELAQVTDGGRWTIAWCAGAGVTGTTAEQLDQELRVFERFLADVARSRLDPSRGAVFLASSAGALYAGASGAPYDETTVPVSISPYGDTKLRMERAVADFAVTTGTPVAVGRISNLYGPGQNLAKPQGLLSQIVRSHLLRRPISIFVSLDTLRDYLYAPDCAGIVLELVATRHESSGGDPVVTKVLCSQRAVTIAAVLAELKRLLRRPPELIYGDSPAAALQAKDLRMRSVVLPHLDARTLTTLPAGLRATIEDMTRQLQAGSLV